MGKMGQAVFSLELAETVEESLRLSIALLWQAEQGFSELVVRNPDTKEERLIVPPDTKEGP